MSRAQIPGITSDEFSRCEERGLKTDHGKRLSQSQKTDAAIKESVKRAFWNDDVLQAIEYYEIDVHVRNGTAYLSGHIVSTTSRSRIENAIRAIPGLLGIQNNLVLDDKLTHEVAISLGSLEHTYGCKFFTGASHGVISLNGIVSDENVKLLAEKCAASNLNVRGVINNIRVSGARRELEDQPFLQPTIGECIFFLDGVSGVVKQVIMNPNNRRVVAMTVRGQFADQRQALKSSNNGNGEARTPERLVVISMDLVRYMTRVSGFLHISSHERERYMDFDSTCFSTPRNDWKAPYPYCPDDVLFPVEKRDVEYQILEQHPLAPLTFTLKEQLLWEQPSPMTILVDNDENKFSNRKLSYFFTPRTHGNVLAWVKPASESERSKRVFENIMRWEDDGGRMPDIGDPTARLNPDTARGRARRE